MITEKLKNRKKACEALLELLKNKYEYASILGTHITGLTARVNTLQTNISDSSLCEFGFVVKVYDGLSYQEYSVSDINNGNYQNVYQDILNNLVLDKRVIQDEIKLPVMGKGEYLEKVFERNDEDYQISEVLDVLNALKEETLSYDKRIINAICFFERYEISKFFLSNNKNLEQNYSWSSIYVMAVARNEVGIKMGRHVIARPTVKEVLNGSHDLPLKSAKLAIELLDSTPIEPGYYDIITAPSITGLIAHEAFGHGVEMDMFVKDRANAKNYVGKRVASDLVDMHDGASATLCCASYFFDDDGELAHDTLIIKKGILQTGISDPLSALELGTTPTGNGRRESYKRKAYTRMTNTFFSPGESNLEDMIKSIEYGYMLFDTDNGMEDPKNWQIQCVAQYGREIKDGKFTGKIVSPVVMSGYVPDLLKSISMVSKEFEVIGSGSCGKGYKEWVRVSDGGPYLKAKVKLA